MVAERGTLIRSSKLIRGGRLFEGILVSQKKTSNSCHKLHSFVGTDHIAASTLIII